MYVNKWAYKYVCVCMLQKLKSNQFSVRPKRTLSDTQQLPAIANWTFVKISLNTHASIIRQTDNYIYEYYGHMCMYV